MTVRLSRDEARRLEAVVADLASGNRQASCCSPGTSPRWQRGVGGRGAQPDPSGPRRGARNGRAEGGPYRAVSPDAGHHRLRGSVPYRSPSARWWVLPALTGRPVGVPDSSGERITSTRHPGGRPVQVGR